MHTEDVKKSFDIPDSKIFCSVAVSEVPQNESGRTNGSVSGLPSHPSHGFNERGSIERIPTELLVRVFRLLPASDLLYHIPLVCKTWYNAYLTPTLHTRLVLRKDVPPGVLYKHFKARPLLRMFRCVALQSAGSTLIHALHLATSLQCLDIGFCNLSEKCAASLGAHLPTTLKHLNVEGIKTIELNFMSNLVTRCPKLEALNLSHCVGICDRCIQLISDELPALQRLNLDGVLWLTDVALQYLIESVSIRAGRLSALWLDGFELTRIGVENFLQSVRDTQNQLRISSLTCISRADTDELGLHILWFSFCDCFTDATIQPIGSLTGITALTLHKAQQITTTAWIELFRLRTGLPNTSLQSLEHVDLSEAQAVNDSVVSALCQCCGDRLRALLLNWCWNLTDGALEEIVASCPQLRHLSLVGDHLIHGHALLDVPTKQPMLSIVNLTQCNNVDDPILDQLTQQMPHLYVFNYFGERVGSELEDICHYDLQRSLGRVPICAD